MILYLQKNSTVLRWWLLYNFIEFRIYRISEDRRKRPGPQDPDFIRYASCFIAMQMGKKLLRDMDIQMMAINYQNFQQAQQLIDQNREAYFTAAMQDIQQALRSLYGEQEISLQQLSATFRRPPFVGEI